MRKIFNQLESFNPDLPLSLLFDYVRIRFPNGCTENHSRDSPPEI